MIIKLLIYSLVKRTR